MHMHAAAVKRQAEPAHQVPPNLCIYAPLQSYEGANDVTVCFAATHPSKIDTDVAAGHVHAGRVLPSWHIGQAPQQKTTHTAGAASVCAFVRLYVSAPGQVSVLGSKRCPACS